MRNRIWSGTCLFLLIILGGFSACNKDESTSLLGNWIRKSDFEGFTRSSAVVFVIDDIAYVGTGFNSAEESYYNDFWKYDPNLNFWQRVADLPGSPRSSAVAFVVDGKGYIGTGYDGENSLNDFWVYNPETNNWKQVADFPGSARYGAVAFSLANKGYVGTGYDGNDLKDFWRFDPSDSTWTQIPSMGGSKRKNATVFTLNNKAYMLTGSHNGSFLTDMWAFNPDLLEQNTFPWVEKNALNADDSYDIAREGACALVANNEVYIALGKGYSYLNTIWHYLPSTDSWEQKTSFEGTGRNDAVSFTLNQKTFVALGRNGTLYLDDIWQFAPLESYNEDD